MRSSLPIRLPLRPQSGSRWPAVSGRTWCAFGKLRKLGIAIAKTPVER